MNDSLHRLVRELVEQGDRLLWAYEHATRSLGTTGYVQKDSWKAGWQSVSAKAKEKLSNIGDQPRATNET